MLRSTDLTYPPSLIFTGATASVKGSAMFSSFAHGKWGVRALAQSLAREFGPQGVHVAHVIIDGVIDIPRTKGWLNDKEDAKISPEAVCVVIFLFPFGSESSARGELWRENWDPCANYCSLHPDCRRLLASPLPAADIVCL